MMDNPFNEEPIYNLKVVVRETGIKPDTLRAWERRYGLPEPARTTGRHRLYSQRDIEIIKWLIRRQEDGLSISRAVELWRSQVSDGIDPLIAEIPQPSILDQIPAGAALDQLRDTWIEACLNFDEATADYVLSQSFALYPPETACQEILQRGLSHIGDLWYQGEASVQQEHFASALAIRRLDALIAASPPPSRPGSILVGCPPGEEHSFPPLLITLMLRQRGWKVIYLGANVPLARFESTVDSLKPNLVVLSAQQLYSAASLLEVVYSLQNTGVPIAYGGRIFNQLPALREKFPAIFIGEDIKSVIQSIDRIITHRPAVPKVMPAPNSYQVALAHYQEVQLALEYEVVAALSGRDTSHEYLAIANLHLSRDIKAALSLGNMDYLGDELIWIKGLIENYGIAPSGLNSYLDIYNQVASTHLDDRGQPILNWLESVKNTL
jgi:methanogenic corrinoid protein MtbC1